MKSLEIKMKLAGLDTEAPVGTVLTLDSENGEWRFLKNRKGWHYLGNFFTEDGRVERDPQPEWMMTR